MSDHRDRAVFQLDEHMKSVLQFMQENVPTSKLNFQDKVGVL
jgi:hypothetical protein